MDQDREDYGDPKPPDRRRGSPLVQFIILVALVLLSLPLIAAIWSGLGLRGGLEAR